MHGLRSWQAAFLTSTSRLVLPIKELRIHADAVGPEEQHLAGTFPINPSHALTEQLSQVSFRWRVSLQYHIGE